MKPLLSHRALEHKRTKSAIREIMDAADPKYFKKIGWNSNDIISFAGGWVNHEAPDMLRRAYRKIVDDDRLFHASGAYSATLGDLRCREAITTFEEHVHGLKSLSPEQVVVGANSTQLAQLLFSAILNPGETVLLTDPTYCNYPAQIVASTDAKVIRFPVLDPESWRYCAEEKAEEFYQFILKHRPKIALIVTPDNPSSQVAPQKFVEAGLAAMKEVGGFLILDFAYKELAFSDSPPAYFQWAPSENFASLHSNSKWCRGLGRRLGWLEAPEFLVESMIALQGVSVLVPDTFHQMAFADYVENGIADGSLKRYITETRRLYENAARHTERMIDEFLALPRLTSHGGLFNCVKVGKSGAEFADEVLRAEGVLFVPGWGFGSTLSDAVRVSFGPLVKNHEAITNGMRKVGTFLKAKR